MDLKSVGSLGRVTKQVELTKEWNVTLKSLSTVETQKALAEIPSSLTNDTSYRGLTMQKAFLKYATTHINNEAVTLEQVDEFYSNLQTPLFNEVYTAFDALSQAQQEALDILKLDDPPNRELWIVSKALNLSPFSPEVAALSPSEFYWTLINYYKDQQDEFNKIKLICRFINPEAAKTVFDKAEVEVTESSEDFMLEQMSKDLKGKYTPEELKAMMDDPKHYESLDRIEKA